MVVKGVSQAHWLRGAAYICTLQIMHHFVSTSHLAHVGLFHEIPIKYANWEMEDSCFCQTNALSEVETTAFSKFDYSTQTVETGILSRCCYCYHIYKKMVTSHSIWCQREIVSPAAQIWIFLENRYTHAHKHPRTHTHIHTASLHETSNIDKVPF